MQLTIERYPDVISSKQLLAASSLFVFIFLFVTHFYFMPYVVQPILGNDTAAKYQSMYFSGVEDPTVQLNLGYKFLHGEGVLKSESQAHYWYEKSARQGEPRAQARLARFYLINKKSKMNYALANKWLEQSIAQNYSYAYALKGWCFYKGTCQDKSHKKAAFYFFKAASLGDAYSHSVLGHYYEKELGGLVHSIDKTIFHYELAKQHGIKNASQQLARVRKLKLKKK